MNFVFSGNEKDLENEISRFIEKGDVRKFINGITNLASCFNCDDEYVIVTTSVQNTNPDIMQLLIPNTNYNINLKAATITIIAAVLDVRLTNGFASLALSLSGFNNHAVVKLDEYKGEKCIVLEILRAKSHTVTEAILPPLNKECFNCNLNCKYRIDDQCKIKEDDIHKIFETLCNKNVIKESEHGRYKYNC